MNQPKPLRLAFSTCPNDTFLFEALIHGRVDTEGLTFEPVLADIAELNAIARSEAVDICKVSFFAWARHLTEKWVMLDSGAALGRGCGPLLITREHGEDWHQGPIAVPGDDTTAHMLLNFFAPQAGPRKSLLFSEIMPAVADGRYRAGVIIHESRFVYPEYGLKLLQDLGEYWEQQTGLPIPLGGIVVHKRLGTDIVKQIDRSLRRSVAYALEQPATVMPYVREHAQEMEDAVMKAHIGLYVNDFTLSLGEEGWAAINRLQEVAKALQGK